MNYVWLVIVVTALGASVALADSALFVTTPTPVALSLLPGSNLERCHVSGTLVLDRGQVSGEFAIVTLKGDSACSDLPAGRFLILKPFSRRDACGSITHRASLSASGEWTYGFIISDNRSHLCNDPSAKQFRIEIFPLNSLGLPSRDGVKVILEGDFIEDAPGGSGAHA